MAAAPVQLTLGGSTVLDGSNKPPAEALHWWQTRTFVLFAALLSTVPLLWPDIPPLLDLPGHMARYRVQLDRGTYPWLDAWYNFHWQLIGNLGVDLLIIPMAKIFGLELGVKLIVLSIPALTVTGLLWIAREVHGRIPATALFALPLVYNFPLHFGFVNFALSMALALNAFALWLRLARLGKLRLRSIVFVPLSCLLWLCHTYGWGMLGVLAFSAELIRQHDLRRREGVSRGFFSQWVLPWFAAGVQCLVLALPMVLMLIWRSGEHVSGRTGDWFFWRSKMQWVTMILRDRWQFFDLACLAVLFLILFKGLRDPNIQHSRNLALSGLFLLAVFLLLPRVVFGSAYADMRLAPYALAIGLIGLRPKPGVSIRNAALFAAAGLAFFTVRMAATTWSFLLYDGVYDRQLQALDHIPRGARLVTFIGVSCGGNWAMSRLEHISGIALERNLAYTNDQWAMEGGQLLTSRFYAPGFATDPSQVVTHPRCILPMWRRVGYSLVTFPRDSFDYVWLVTPPPYEKRLEQGLIPVWRGPGNSAVFRIDHNVPAATPGRWDTPPPRRYRRR